VTARGGLALVVAGQIIAAAALLAGAPPFLAALLGVPAVLWAPGLGWARWLAARRGGADALEVGLDAAWIAVALAVVEVSVVREAGLPPAWLLPLAVVAGLPGFALAWRAGPPTARVDRAVRWGLVGVFVAVAGTGLARSSDLVRPLDAYWWDARAETLGEAVPLDAPGFRPAAGGALARDAPAGTHALEARAGGRVLVLARGAVGLGAALTQGGRAHDSGRVERDPVEDRAEGAVPRYLDAGTVSLAGDLAPGRFEVRTTGPARLVVLPGLDALHAAHGSGLARHVHYWQILNMVENQRWAAEVLRDRRATFHQPPLWSYALAVPVALGAPDLEGAGALFLWVLLLAGASTVRLVRTIAPRAGLLALLLPALAVAGHGRLMIGPGSFGFPDSAYAAALVAAVAAVLAGAWTRAGLLGLASSLLRYPGLLLAAVAAGLARLAGAPRPRLRALGPATGVLAALLALLAVSGRFPEWAAALRSEVLPEHWHGEGDPRVLLGRVPRFLALWLGYAGATPLLAVLGARGPALVPLGVAAAAALLLCTVDHSPSHYFLPLVYLPVASLAAGAPAGRRGTVLLVLGILGLAASLVAMPVL